MSCDQKSFDYRVKQLAAMLRVSESAGRHLKAGVCQFCGATLPYSYRVQVIETGKVHNVRNGDTKGESRAMKLVELNPFKASAMVFPLSACDVMTDKELYSKAVTYNRLRSQVMTEMFVQEERNRSHAEQHEEARMLQEIRKQVGAATPPDDHKNQSKVAEI